LTVINEGGEAVAVNGAVRIHVGGSLPGKRSQELGATTVVTTNVQMGR